MLISEKNFLERIAALIPGVGGYRERDSRRETDRRLREYLARRLDEARHGLHAARRNLTNSRRLDLLDDVGQIERILARSVGSLRFADHGYSGLFDQVKIREAELDRIYAYDEALVADVEALLGVVTRASSTPEAGVLPELRTRAEALDRKITGRSEIFETPEPRG
jgi:hypothetical protein